MDMSSSSSSSSSSGGMNMNTMLFTLSTSTPLYTPSWTPHTLPAYAGTCIFLLLLASLYRALYATKTLLERRFLDRALRRRYVVVAGKPRVAEELAEKEGEGERGGLLTVRGVEEEVRVVRQGGRGVRAWRWSEDLPRAGMVVVISGVGYLLMLAVMTMNVGYFLSILAGIFLGEIVVGRWVVADEH